MTSQEEEIRIQIAALVRELYRTRPVPEFVPGTSTIGYAGRVYDADEITALVDSSLDFWLTAGPRAAEFEAALAQKAGTKYALLVNSGSSANLAAISALSSPKLKDRLRPGDEVVTAAAAFPTTVNPIIQNGWLPVFVDIEVGTYNASYDAVAAAIGPKTRAIVLAHAMGIPYEVDRIAELAKKHGLYLIEDCCDALGATVAGRPVGTFGHAATISFYPAHQLTMGEGGAVLTNSGKFQWIVRSFRDWGRDCWCEPGEDDACRKRFGYQLGQLPLGYDHKYTYAHRGYNFKALDLQAAIGLVQLGRLDSFVAARRANWSAMRAHLCRYEQYLVLPDAPANSEPSPFGLALTVRTDAPFAKKDLVDHLEKNKVQTRVLFAGNILRHPAYADIQYRIADTLENSDLVTENTFFVGVYPGIDAPRRDHMLQAFDGFFRERRLA